MNQQIEFPSNTSHLPSPRKKPSTPSTDDSRRFGSSRRGVILLVLFALIMVGAMVTGIVFVAHTFYHEFGGQGFLKVKVRNGASNIVGRPTLYLPLRVNASQRSPEYFSGSAKRSPGNVPFYTCGDQLLGCEKYGQPVSHLKVKDVLECHSNHFPEYLLPYSYGLLPEYNYIFDHFLL
jgi:hypothetical protein